jgi:metallo-beta-lactamase family protein
MMLSFHGADRAVTGSCHRLEAAGLRLLVDCGLYQGRRELADENRGDFGFDPRDIDVLLLTHAHLDHCGRIPLLVKRGFRGEIIATSATRELARLVLLDAAHVQEEDAKRAARRARRAGETLPEPLYTLADAMWALDRFGRVAAYDTPLALNDSLSVRFIDAGHILGSSSIVVDVREAGRARRILFSGDLGVPGHPIIRDPTPPPKADYVVIETTYGDRLHRSLDESVDELWEAVRTTIERGGNVLVPTFALERTQDILYFLREGMERGRLPARLPIFLDSPMAISATEIMRRHPECFDEETTRDLAKGDPLAPPGLHYSREAADSMALNKVTGGAVIMAGSGMCTGGRIRHHLRHNLWRRQASVVFVGYAAEGTLARRIIDGEHSVDLFGEPVQVNAHVHTINGFSAHADQAGLLAWHRAAGEPAMTFLVHGDEDRGMAWIAAELARRGRPAMMPALHQSIALG